MKTNSDNVSIQELINLAKTGNMEAKRLGFEKLREAEATAARRSVRFVLGEEGHSEFIERLNKWRIELMACPHIGKTPICKLADAQEVEALC